MRSHMFFMRPHMGGERPVSVDQGSQVEVSFSVNGERRVHAVDPDTTLLSVLRDLLALTGAKEACGRGECGACTVLIGGRPVAACLTLARRVRDEVTTVEGLGEDWQDLREAFADHGGFQCGFCTSGQLVHAAAILLKGLPSDPSAAEAAIRHQLSGNICRCTGYVGIVDSILAVVSSRSANGAPLAPDA